MTDSISNHSDLPQGWKWVKLNDIADIKYGKNLPIKSLLKNGKYPVFGANGIIGYYNIYHYESERVLISCRGAYSGTINYSPPKCFITNNSLALDIINKDITYKKYLYYSLQSIDKTKLVTGTAQPQVTVQNASHLLVPLPPLPEQHRIVEKIEELFSELDSGVASLKKALEQLKTYRQAVLKWAFEGKLTEKWRNAHQDTLEDADTLLQQIKAERKRHYQQQLEDWKQALKDWETNGKKTKKPTKPQQPKDLPPLTKEELSTLPSLPDGWMWTNFCNVTYKIGDIDHKMPRDYPNGYPYLSTGNLQQDGIINFENAKTISPEDFDRLSLKIQPQRGDIIFPRYGTIGRNFLVNFDKKFLVSYSCAIIKNITKIMNEKFVFYYSLSPYIKKEIKRYVKETTQANIGIASIESFVFPLCSGLEQTQIVQEIESRLSICDQLEATLTENLEKAEALRQSILKRAFEGKLVL